MSIRLALGRFTAVLLLVGGLILAVSGSAHAAKQQKWVRVVGKPASQGGTVRATVSLSRSARVTLVAQPLKGNGARRTTKPLARGRKTIAIGKLKPGKYRVTLVARPKKGPAVRINIGVATVKARVLARPSPASKPSPSPALAPTSATPAPEAPAPAPATPAPEVPALAPAAPAPAVEPPEFAAARAAEAARVAEQEAEDIRRAEEASRADEAARLQRERDRLAEEARVAEAAQRERDRLAEAARLQRERDRLAEEARVAEAAQRERDRLAEAARLQRERDRLAEAARVAREAEEARFADEVRRAELASVADEEARVARVNARLAEEAREKEASDARVKAHVEAARAEMERLARERLARLEEEHRQAAERDKAEFEELRRRIQLRIEESERARALSPTSPVPSPRPGLARSQSAPEALAPEAIDRVMGALPGVKVEQLGYTSREQRKFSGDEVIETLAREIGEKRLIKYIDKCLKPLAELPRLHYHLTKVDADPEFKLLAPKVSPLYLARWVRSFSRSGAVKKPEADDKCVTGITLSVRDEAKLDLALRFSVVSALQRAPEKLVFLNDSPDLSDIHPDGTLFILNHGAPGYMEDLFRVMKALVDPVKGLPQSFRGKIKLIACDGASVAGGVEGKALIDHLARLLSTPGRQPIAITGFKSTFTAEFSMMEPKGEPAVTQRRKYIRAFFFGELAQLGRDPQLEQDLNLKEADFGTLAHLGPIRKAFSAGKGSVSRATVADMVRYKNALEPIKQLLIDEGVMLSKQVAKRTAWSQPKVNYV